MKEIPLTQGKVALVDDEDFYWLSRHKWCSHTSRKYSYGMRSLPIAGSKNNKALWMHRCIVACPIGFDVDHIDGNGLNNQKSNLRIAKRAGNSANSNVVSRSTGFKGVRLAPECVNRWEARIVKDGKISRLGNYGTPEEAAAAYDRAAFLAHGEFAKTNKMMGLI